MSEPILPAGCARAGSDQQFDDGEPTPRCKGDDMLFQLQFQSRRGAFSYLVGAIDSDEAILIDPVEECFDCYAQLLARLDYTLRYTLETGSVEGSDRAASELSNRWGCSSVVPCDGHRDGQVIRVGHGDELRLAQLCIEVVGEPGRRQDTASFLVDDRAFVGSAAIQSKAQLLDLPVETLIYRSRSVRGTNFGLIGLEAGAALRDGGLARSGGGMVRAPLQLEGSSDYRH